LEHAEPRDVLAGLTASDLRELVFEHRGERDAAGELHFGGSAEGRVTATATHARPMKPLRG
jgi:hypothetical protein